MATMIQFRQRSTLTAPTLRPASPTTSNRHVQPAVEHHRGLHLVTYTSVPALQVEDTQARANRIVAQVEREVALQVARERLDQMNRTYQTTPRPLPSVTSIETPATVARRLFQALLAFAIPA